MEIFPEDYVFTYAVDVRGFPSSLGLPNAVKDLFIILHLEPQEETKNGTAKEVKTKKLKDEFIKNMNSLIG